MRKRTGYLLLAVGVGSVLAAVASQAPQQRDAVVSAVPSAPEGPVQSDLFPSQLPRRSSIEPSSGELFNVRAAPSPPSRAQQPVVVAPPAPPVPPYRFVGSLTYDGQRQYILANGERVFPTAQGDAVDGVYRVEAVELEKITLRYLPLDALVELPFVPHSGSTRSNTAIATTPPPVLSAPPLVAASESAPNPAGPVRAAQLRGPRNIP